MWRFNVEKLTQTVDKLWVLGPDGPLTFLAFLKALRDDVSMQQAMSHTLRSQRFDAFRWELPALTRRSASASAEFVMVDTPGLVRTPSPRDFAKPLADADPGLVATFPNLGGDALMIVPRQVDPEIGFAHLAEFLTLADDAHVEALWSAAAGAALDNMSDTARWLNTAGMGVPWLHVRLDSRPKYYRHRPYASH